MKPERRFILIFGVLFCGAVIFYSLAQIKATKGTVLKQKDRILKLEAQLLDLNNMLETFQKSDSGLRTEFAQQRARSLDFEEKLKKAIGENKILIQDLARLKTEKDQSAGLDKSLKSAISQNETLRRELARMKDKFPAVQPVKTRLGQIETALAGLNLAKGKEDLLNIQLDAILEELNNINKYLLSSADSGGIMAGRNMPALDEPRKEKSDFGEELKVREELNTLKNVLNLLNKDNTILKEKYKIAEEVIRQNKLELSGKYEELSLLQEKLTEAQNYLADLQAKYKEMEKSYASLREKYVGNELEKDMLKVSLKQTETELADLRQKFLALLTNVSNIFKSNEDKGASKIDVELIPGLSEGAVK